MPPKVAPLAPDLEAPRATACDDTVQSLAELPVLPMSEDRDDDDLASVLVVNLVRTHNRLAPYIGAGLRDSKLTAAQLNALMVLHSVGEKGLLMSELGEQLVVTKSNVTGLVDRLERQGLVERHPHRDRRATTIKLTAAGSTVLGRALPEHRRRLAQLAQCLEPRDQRQLIHLLTKLRRALRERSA